MKIALALSFFTLALGSAFAANLPESQKIDALLAKHWEKAGVKANPPVPDEVLVRRLYLDIAGRVPTLAETRAFLSSSAPDKRQRLIDDLLASDGYTSHTFNYFADLLRLTDNTKGRVTAQAYEEWLKKKLKANTPYDQLVRELLTTDGAVWNNGAIGFYMRDENKLDHLAYTVQTFLGTQIVCAQCHNHPFDKWTQMDYYHLASYTYGMDQRSKNGLEMKGNGKAEVDIPKPDLTGKTPQEAKALKKDYRQKVAAAREGMPQVSREDAQQVKQALQDVVKPLRYTNISWNDKDKPKLPHDYAYSDGKPGQVIEPRVLFGHDAIPKEGETRLQAFADWMTSPENPRFTTVIANRLWKRVFAQGLIEPVDEMMDSTVASQPALMDYLTQLMIAQKYSIKDFLRIIYNTDTYQRMADTQEVALGEHSHFTGPQLRRMSAEQIWDSLSTMVRGNVDSTVDEENERLHSYMDDLSLLVDTLKEKGVPGLAELAKKANAANEENLAKLEAQRKALLSSKDPADLAKVKELAQEANRLRRERSQDMLVGILGEDRAAKMRRGYNDKQDEKKRIKPDAATLAKINELPKNERKAALKAFFTAARPTTSMSVRASELPSPAKPGSILRTFGQSDREEIENSSRDASIPQALALLNGPLITAVVSPGSNLSSAIDQASAPIDRASILYEAFLSRQPSSQETTILQSVIDQRGPSYLEDIAHALLTGSQFLFIQ
jgi:hypothetical protein